MKSMIALLLLLLVSYSYYVWNEDIILLTIPLIALSALRLLGKSFMNATAAMFVASLFGSSLMLYFDLGLYQPLGVLAFAFFFTMAAAAYLDWIGFLHGKAKVKA